MSKTKNIQPLGLFIQQGKIGDVFYTDKKSNYIHSLCQYYKRTATCDALKAIEEDKVVTLLKVTILE